MVTAQGLNLQMQSLDMERGFKGAVAGAFGFIVFTSSVLMQRTLKDVDAAFADAVLQTLIWTGGIILILFPAVFWLILPLAERVDREQR